MRRFAVSRQVLRSICTWAMAVDVAVVCALESEAATPTVDLGAHTFVGLQKVDEERFTNPNTGETVGVPSAYIDEISPWLEFYGIKYDPWGDFDNDGVINYFEYLAGTDPFDATHVLRITGFRSSAKLHEITFEYVGGHLYGVKATSNLAKPEWTPRKIRPTPDADEQMAVLPSSEPDDVGEATIYVPVSGEPCEFFMIVPM